MSKIKKLWKKIKKAQKKLSKKKKEEGLEPRKKNTSSNSKSKLETVEDEKEERQKVIEEHLKVFRSILPDLLKRLSEIDDPRNPKTIEHKLASVLLYGLLMFVLQMSSRREANRKLTRPQFMKNLKTIFPELESLPHGDTVNRILSQIDVEKIQETLIYLVKDLIKNKKFDRFKLDDMFMIAIDGTEKFYRETPWTEETLERKVNTKDGKKKQYYVYVLEATIVFPNGITIPLISEILERSKGDTDNNKQDCEINAFKRLAAQIKEYFPRTPITLLLDGLYPNGPVMEICQEYNWDYMIVLKEDSLKTIWEEAYGLKKIETGNTYDQTYGDRKQHFWWINDIEYSYGDNNKNHIKVNVVVCEETWEEVDKQTGEIVQKTTKHAWISSKRINKNNVNKRCNLMARYRWSIENNILVEKHHGYEMEHCFSKNWNAMKGFHYLMRLGHLLNVLVHNSINIFEFIKEVGVGELIDYVRETLSSPWLDYERMEKFISKRHQIRLRW